MKKMALGDSRLVLHGEEGMGSVKKGPAEPEVIREPAVSPPPKVHTALPPAWTRPPANGKVRTVTSPYCDREGVTVSRETFQKGIS